MDDSRKTPKDSGQKPPATPENEARALTPAARRALAEAEARRRSIAETTASEREVGGRDGPEPTRYGDWERSGITSDF
jgi:hypothetical protein